MNYRLKVLLYGSDEAKAAAQPTSYREQNQAISKFSPRHKMVRCEAHRFHNLTGRHFCLLVTRMVPSAAHLSLHFTIVRLTYSPIELQPPFEIKTDLPNTDAE